jgi:type I restriction enzyme M protein
LRIPRLPLIQKNICWSEFKKLDDAEKLLKIVRDEAFPFIKDMGQATKSSTYAKHMRDAVFLIASPKLLEAVIGQIEQIPMADRDTKGDLYEYMLSKLSTAGTNGQFRTPRHIIKMMVELLAPGPRKIICDPACGTGGFLVAVAEYLRELTFRVSGCSGLCISRPNFRHSAPLGLLGFCAV